MLTEAFYRGMKIANDEICTGKTHGKIDYTQRNKHEIMEMNNTIGSICFIFILLYSYCGGRETGNGNETGGKKGREKRNAMDEIARIFSWFYCSPERKKIPLMNNNELWPEANWRFFTPPPLFLLNPYVEALRKLYICTIVSGKPYWNRWNETE